MASGRGARERAGTEGRVASALLSHPTVAGEAPGAPDEDADTDPCALLVLDSVDLAVPRRDPLGAPGDDPRIRVRGPSSDRGVDCSLTELLHRSTLSAPRRRKAFRFAHRAGGLCPPSPGRIVRRADIAGSRHDLRGAEVGLPAMSALER